MTSRSSLHVGGRTRTYTLVPAAGSSGPAGKPLLLVFHGSNQTGAKVRTMSGFDALSEHFHVVYPDAYRGSWNDGRPQAPFPAARKNIDDIGFTEAVVAEAGAQLHVSDVYAAGYSNGGQFVLRLTREVPGLLKGAVLFSAAQPVPSPNPEPAPLPVLLFHGTKDRLVPYDGGVASLWGFRPRGEGMSAPGTAAYLAQRNGITTPPTTTRTESSLPVLRTDYRQDGKPPVTLFTVEGGGHVIPGHGRAPFVLGKLTRELDAAQEILAFLTPMRVS